jgi:hypothetical protein
VASIAAMMRAFSVSFDHASAVVDGGRQLEEMGFGCLKLVVPDRTGHWNTLEAPSDRTHRAADFRTRLTSLKHRSGLGT